METGDESDGQEALLIHLPPQEEVALQVVQAEVVLATGGRDTGKRMVNIIHYIVTNQLFVCCFLTSPLRLTWEGLRRKEKTQLREIKKTSKTNEEHQVR